MLYNIYVHIIYLLTAHILDENIFLLIVYIHCAWTVTHIVLKAKFLVPGLGDKVDSGVGLSYRTGPHRLHRLASRCYIQPYARVNYSISPTREYRICKVGYCIYEHIHAIYSILIMNTYVVYIYCTYWNSSEGSWKFQLWSPRLLITPGDQVASL